ncbi:MAG: hypothetical protein AAB606_02330 [Patescibacteria group bacterium]
MRKGGGHKFRLVVLCGGISMERGISLNSCRSVCDHLDFEDIEIQPVYFDYHKGAHLISKASLYSNTPSDFDFKLEKYSKKLSKRALAKVLKQADLVFPVIHGAFGEDGQLQKILESINCRFVGSKSAACKTAFNKYKANELLKSKGFFSLPTILLKSHVSRNENLTLLKNFFKKEKLQRAVVKPVSGGSSIGVHSVSTPTEALVAMEDIFNKKLDTQAVCEPFCDGKEFTVVILQNRFRMPVALIPSEIETSYKENQIFDFRKKYLPTHKVKYHCPPRFPEATIEKIQVTAENLFKLLGMSHFGRFDGWVTKDGQIWFSDFNPISGMEQNSFLFQQAAQIGMTHRDVLVYILKRAAEKYGVDFNVEPCRKSKKKTCVNVIGGGTSAERQVSLMSSTNVWLKLRQSHEFWPELYLLTGDHEVWHVPYNFALNHTVEEINDMCRSAARNSRWLNKHAEAVLLKLNLVDGEASEELFQPQKLTLEDFLNLPGFVFNGLHGGIGENGVLQAELQSRGKKFNGAKEEASRLCMDKFATGEAIKKLNEKGIYTAAKRVFLISHFENFSKKDWDECWRNIRWEFCSKFIIAKPVDDGCSAGICKIVSAQDFRKYIAFAIRGEPEIPKNTLKDQHGVIEMPTHKMKNVLLEQYIETDKVRVVKNGLKWDVRTNWIEITSGVIGKKHKLHAFNPSLTVAVGSVLSLEEKFQGGTGINITPPPTPHVKSLAVSAAKRHIEAAANHLGIEGYARIDAFMHTKTGEIYIIEANTLPALTPSTVIFHQALAEKRAMYPREFIEKIIKNAV